MCALHVSLCLIFLLGGRIAGGSPFCCRIRHHGSSEHVVSVVHSVTQTNRLWFSILSMCILFSRTLLCLSACLYLQTHTQVHACALMRACTRAGGHRLRAFWLFFCLREAFLFLFRIYVDYSWIASLGAAAIATIMWSFQELHKLLFFEIELDRQQVSSPQGGEGGRDREGERKRGKGEI